MPVSAASTHWQEEEEWKGSAEHMDALTQLLVESNDAAFFK